MDVTVNINMQAGELNPDNHLLDITKVRIDPACALKIPANIALRRKVLPFLEMDGVIHIASFNLK
ncbi:MAG: hypothetical protein HGB14_07210, partial [Anaerolineaceae bacterium]|nr:hypothetical protein [Anaerolineaceae bacterium]